jgi:hypothetical protein
VSFGALGGSENDLTPRVMIDSATILDTELCASQRMLPMLDTICESSSIDETEELEIGGCAVNMSGCPVYVNGNIVGWIGVTVQVMFLILSA